MTGKDTQREPSPAPKGRSLLASPVIPGAIAIVVLGIIVASMAGLITLPHIGPPHVQELPPAVRGDPCSYNFRDALIPLLDPSGSTDPAIYTFYLGSNVGFPPMGLILGTDGILKGVPTGEGGVFQVCVRDVGGRSACRDYHLDVIEPEEEQPVAPGSCPDVLDPPCDSTGSGTVVRGGKVPANCECPKGSHYSGTIDRTVPGRPYKICVCD